MGYQKTAAVLGICMLAVGIMSMPAGAVTIDCNQHTMLGRPIDLGVSGGNINSFLNHHTACFSGTLGAEVHDRSSKQFILSNNHVIADLNTAKPGELIVQPGLVDTNPACTKTPDDAVANFTRAIKLNFGGGKNTVDAALAAVLPGDVDTNGEILNIGPIASTTVSATIGLPVQKMGSATCVTTGTITSVGAKVNVTYPGGKKAKFIDQIFIAVQDFGNPGDSGSLILTQDPCPQAVGLLFAGSADHSLTIANPIGAVLNKLGVSMTGGGCPAMATASPQAVTAENAAVSKDLVDSASAVRDRHEDELMKIPGAVGTAIGVSDTPGQPAIEVYVGKMTPEAQAATPKDVDGVPVKLIENGGFVAY
jgi:hypothetical protein